jgi:prepilin-type N-terminal cleavage/methylation domain-containing protein
MTPAVRRRRDGAAGFTLLEVAIALAIIGVGVVTVLELFSAALRMESGAGMRTRAVVHARGLLDAAMALPEIKPGGERGRIDDVFRYEVGVREAPEYLDSNKKDLDVQSDVVMYEIQVSVLWTQTADREGVYTIRTLRLAPHTTS